MSRANEKRRDGEVLSVWSMDGAIYVKTSPDGRPIKINDLEDLESLLPAKYFGRRGRTLSVWKSDLSLYLTCKSYFFSSPSCAVLFSCCYRLQWCLFVRVRFFRLFIPYFFL